MAPWLGSAGIGLRQTHHVVTYGPLASLHQGNPGATVEQPGGSRRDSLLSLELAGGLGKLRQHHSRAGLAALHPALWRDDTPIAVAPPFLKGHSYGEFVFDQTFARLAADLGCATTPNSGNESGQPGAGLPLPCAAWGG